MREPFEEAQLASYNAQNIAQDSLYRVAPFGAEDPNWLPGVGNK